MVCVRIQRAQAATNNHIALPLAEIQHGLRECANENGQNPRRNYSYCSWCSSCSSCSCVSRCSRVFGFNRLSMISLAANICCSHLSLFLPAAQLRLTNSFCFRLSLHIYPCSSTYSSIHVHSLVPHFHWWQTTSNSTRACVLRCYQDSSHLSLHIHPYSST